MIEPGYNHVGIEDEQIIVTKDICLFGARRDCREYGQERIEYCVMGKYKSCEHYQELRKSLEYEDKLNQDKGLAL